MKPQPSFKPLLLLVLLVAVGFGQQAKAQETIYQPVLVDDTIHWTMPIEMWLAGCTFDEFMAYPFSGYHELWYFVTYSDVPRLLGQLHSSEDNAKLYFQPADSEEEFLIMDLTLSIGDTFHTKDHYGQQHDLFVDSVYFLYGKKHIRFNETIEWGYPDSYRMFIEGVGPNWGLQERFCDGGYLYFICKYNGDSLCYAVSDASFENCDFREPCIGDGIVEIDTPEPSKIYPNPFTDFFTLDNPDAETHLMIYDCMGRVCMEKDLQPGHHVINIQNNPAGIYIVCLICNGKSEFYKIIKNE